MKDHTAPALDARTRDAVEQVLARVPAGLFLMTAGHEGRTRGVLVNWVQQVSADPPIILIALSKGHDIVPIIQESHSFAVHQVAHDDKLILRKFATDTRDDDPLQGMEVLRRTTGSPILARTQAYLDCQLLRHLDIEGDHNLYIGLVRDGGILKGGPIHITPTPDENHA